jgi:hypothetical protein
MRALSRWAVAAAAAGLLAAPADAQVAVSTGWPPPMVNPWNPGWTFSKPPLIGHLPNGTPVVNPWDRGGGFITPAVPAWQTLFAQQYAQHQAAMIWNPTLYPFWASGGMNVPWGLNAGQPVMQPGGFGPGVQPVPAGAVPAQPVSSFVARPGPVTQVEPGRFSRLGPDLAVNRATGTVLRPYSGVAFTAEGPFVRMAGSGTFTPWGAYVPGTGVFVNPFTGAAYNPQTGLILR